MFHVCSFEPTLGFKKAELKEGDRAMIRAGIISYGTKSHQNNAAYIQRGYGNPKHNLKRQHS
eukprot:5126650-Amphidinium_carterae.1